MRREQTTQHGDVSRNHPVGADPSKPSTGQELNKTQALSAVVTGGAHGIGLACARRFLSHGWAVCLVDADDANFDQLDAEGFRVVHAAIGSVPECDLVEEIVHRAGVPSAVVANVGINDGARLHELTAQNMRTIMRVNAEAPVLITRDLLNHAADTNTAANAVFISSVHAGSVGCWPAYAMSKAAVEAAVREMAVVYAPDGIRVNAIRPGWIRTSDQQPTPSELRRNNGWIPAGRGGEAHEIAAAAYWLCSPDASYVTGACLSVDGGLALHSWMVQPWNEPLGGQRPTPG